MPSRSDVKFLLIVTVALVVALPAGLYLIEEVSYRIERGRLEALRQHLATNPATQRESATVRNVIRLVSPSVISIVTESGFAVAARQADGNGRDDPPAPPARDPATTPMDEVIGTPVRQGTGSGFIFDAERGLALTNAHVVRGADALRAYRADGTELTVEILAQDEASDVAVLRLGGAPLPALTFGDSAALNLGDEVLAAGSPFGLSGSFSRGIVSGVERRQISVGALRYDHLIQTDTVVMPGSSGGPLVNMQGQVVGMNTAIATEDGQYDGVSFAIPSCQLLAALEQLVGYEPPPQAETAPPAAPVEEKPADPQQDPQEPSP